jgi:hypothetical protein
MRTCDFIILPYHIATCSFEVEILNSNSQAPDFTQIILSIIKERKPESVKQLTRILRENYGLPEDEVIKSVMKLQAEGLIKLRNQTLRAQSLVDYLKTAGALWYWLTIAVEAITTVLFSAISESAYPWIYARTLLGLIFILFLPGFAFLKALFPVSVPEETSKGNIGAIEQFALSVGMSIAFVSIAGLLLYYSPWGLSMTTAVTALFAFTSVFATAAVLREYNTKKSD